MISGPIFRSRDVYLAVFPALFLYLRSPFRRSIASLVWAFPGHFSPFAAYATKMANGIFSIMRRAMLLFIPILKCEREY